MKLKIIVGALLLAVLIAAALHLGRDLEPTGPDKTAAFIPRSMAPVNRSILSSPLAESRDSILSREKKPARSRTLKWNANLSRSQIQSDLESLRKLYDIGADQDLIQRLTGLVDENPKVPEYLAGLAEVLLKLGRAEEAEKILKRLLTLDPQSEFALGSLADLLADQQRFKESIELNQRILLLQPRSMDAMIRLLNDSEAIGSLDNAIEIIASIYRQDGNGNAAAILAEDLARQNRLSDASSLVELSLKKEPENPYLLHVAARVLGDQFHFVEASKRAEQAAEKYVDTEQKLDSLSLAVLMSLKSNNIDHAESILSKIKKLDREGRLTINMSSLISSHRISKQ